MDRLIETLRVTKESEIESVIREEASRKGVAFSKLLVQARNAYYVKYERGTAGDIDPNSSTSLR